MKVFGTLILSVVALSASLADASSPVKLSCFLTTGSNEHVLASQTLTLNPEGMFEYSASSGSLRKVSVSLLQADVSHYLARLYLESANQPGILFSTVTAPLQNRELHVELSGAFGQYGFTCLKAVE